MISYNKIKKSCTNTAKSLIFQDLTANFKLLKDSVCPKSTHLKSVCQNNIWIHSSYI